MMKVWRDRDMRFLLISAVAAALAISALCGLLYVRTWQNKQVRDQVLSNCTAIENIKTTIRGTFMDARDRIQSNSDISPAQKIEALMYYDRELARYKQEPCP